MGLISLDEMDLEILIETREEDCETLEERQELTNKKLYASRVLPLVRRHHELLVTLLLMNCLANESLPLFLDSLVPSWVAVLLSVSMILLFGEILPSAVFTGEEGLRISSLLSPFVYLGMFALYPLVFPIAKILDYSLPHTSIKYSKAEVLALLRLHVHHNEAAVIPADTLPSRTLSLYQNEVKIIQGALSLRNATVESVMSRSLFMVHEMAVLDSVLLGEIVHQGHSRIPVYGKNRNEITGLLLTKKLTSVSGQDGKRVKDIPLREATFVTPNDSLAQVLKLLRMSKQHMAIVRSAEEGEEVLGVVTLLDVIQKLVDEDLREEETTLLNTPQLSSSTTMMTAAVPVGRWDKMKKSASTSSMRNLLGNVSHSELSQSLLSTGWEDGDV